MSCPSSGKCESHRNITAFATMDVSSADRNVLTLTLLLRFIEFIAQKPVFRLVMKVLK
jgi:hypothetical protein